MSNEMPSWRTLASAASRSIKGYVAQRDPRRPIPGSRDIARPDMDGQNKSTWGQWAGQKLRAIQGDGSTVSSETISLFPGWACRKYAHPPRRAAAQDPAPFSIEISVSGFATRSSGQGFGSRAGRTFLRLAKSYASLPKLVVAGEAYTASPQSLPSSSSTDDLLRSMHLPAKPNDMTDEAEMEALNEQLKHLDMDNASLRTAGSSASSQRSGSPTLVSPTSLYPPSASDIQLRRMHSNLESRLYPFWASALGSRCVRISVFTTHPVAYQSYKSPPLGEDPYDDEDAPQHRPIVSEEIATAADGSFQLHLSIPWERICTHAGGVHIAFGEPDVEHELFITADLLPGPSRPVSPNATTVPYAVRQPRVHRAVLPTDSKTLTVPLTGSPVRLISDIDDTVKMSGILSGTRAVFHNVFVKDLAENVIPGMGEWYMNMWRHGVRFHYVSNSPFELLPVINEFIHLSQLPPGSVKLKSYAGRSLFNGLLSAPAERKRAGIADLLDSFSDARFFLVGDSGEQDLELYASLARERPPQILGIFIRDASDHELVAPLDDPTGRMTLLGAGPPSATRMGGSVATPRRGSGRLLPDALGRRRMTFGRSATSPPVAIKEEPDYFSSHLLIDAPISDEPVSLSPTASNAPPSFALNGYRNESFTPGVSDGYFTPSSSARTAMTPGAQFVSDAQRKQQELQMRVCKARSEIPEHIALRVFRHPSECVEAIEILDRLNMGRRQL